MKMIKQSIKVCPRCRKAVLPYAAGITGQYICDSCGYIGPLVIEIEKKSVNEKISKEFGCVRPVVLLIRDGWGRSNRKKGNAILMAKTPNTDKLMKSFPRTVLKASGKYVGLPDGNQGNSEVGHLNIGSGRVVYQSLVRIDNSIRDGSFFRNEALSNAMKNVNKHNSALHIMGLVQDEGVHAHSRHLYALLKLAKNHNVKNVFIHLFSDGRDTPPKSALKFLREIEKEMKKHGGRIGTVMGRYYSMDRDNRWDRTEKAYNALVRAEGFKARTAEEAISLAYKRGESDEFIKPTIIEGFERIRDNDSVIFFNYRLDRARQLTHLFLDKKSREFRNRKLKIFFACMTEYYNGLKNVAFEPLETKNNLGEILSRNRLKQLRISETEKYAQVTFFFNSQIEKRNKLEDRVLIPSPKVATYDMKPEMSAYKVTEKAIGLLPKYDVIIMNLANCDMVGHTGKLKAAIKAVEAVDDCVGKIAEEVLKMDGVLLVTADHGNAEQMLGRTQTSHTNNDVDFIFVSRELKKARLRKGSLADIAPTILKLLNIRKPNEMTGKSLL